MTSLIKGCLFAALLALPAMANATLFQQYIDKEFGLADHGAFSWTRADDGQSEARHPLLEQLFNFKPEQHAWGQWEHHEPRLLPKLIMGIAMLFHHFDFSGSHHGWDWKHHDTTEVPVPAALPLFSLALVTLGWFKRRSNKA